MITSLYRTIICNFKPALAVALVSIPISISLSIAAHANPLLGIIGSIVAGFVAAIVGSSKYNIIGPTGSVTGILATFVGIYGPATIPLLAIIAGLFGVCAYALRLERYIIFIPASAIHGFILGIALIVILGQINSAFGLPDLPKHKLFIYNVYESILHLNLISWDTFILFMIFLVQYFVLSWLLPKIPGAIILTPLGIVVGYAAQKKIIPLTLETLGTKYGSINTLKLQLPEFTLFPSLMMTGLAIAFIAMLETMISGKIADGITKTKHNRQQELLGLACANIVTGLCGGMPSSASYARTSINIKNGANSKMSQGMSAVLTAVIAWLVLPSFTYLPLSVIAAILVYVAYRMVEKQHLIRFFNHDKRSFAISMVVALVTLVENPVVGILFGTALACIFLLEQMSTGFHDSTSLEQTPASTAQSNPIPPKDVLIYSIKGPLVYINSQAHISRFESGVGNHKIVILRMRGVYFMDSDGLDALDEIISLILRAGAQVIVTRLHPQVEQALKTQTKQYQQLVDNNQIFKTTHDALVHLGITPHSLHD